MAQFYAILFFPCILSLCLPLLTNTLSYTIHLLMTYNYRCLLSLTKYPSFFTLFSHLYLMSKLDQRRTFLNLITTRQNSCLSTPIDLSIDIAYLHQSLLAMLKFSTNSLWRCLVLHYTVFLPRKHMSTQLIGHATLNCVVLNQFVDTWQVLQLPHLYLVACFCYLCHSSTAPSYVTDTPHEMPSLNRFTHTSSYTMPLLIWPAHSMATLGDRSFSFALCSFWISIPNDFRCAPSQSLNSSRLKTYLFRSVCIDRTFSLITVNICIVRPCQWFFDGLS